MDTEKLTEVIMRVIHNKVTKEDLKFLQDNEKEIKELNNIFEMLFGDLLKGE